MHAREEETRRGKEAEEEGGEEAEGIGTGRKIHKNLGREKGERGETERECDEEGNEGEETTGRL